MLADELLQNPKATYRPVCFVETDRIGEDRWQIDRVSASASEKDGVVTLTVANCSMDEPADVRVRGVSGRVEGRILTAEAHAFNEVGRILVGHVAAP